MTIQNDLLMLKGVVSMMDAEGQATVNSIKIAIEECIERHAECGPIALALVGLETMIKG